jgi:archaellum component FlaC
MQEKIGQAPPPEIKIIEGKPPPTSWVTENVVQFYQVQSQIEVLTDIMSYVHELQSNQLTQTRGKPLVIKESFVSMPDKGSAADISNKATYNSMQGYIKSQIQDFGTLIETLKQGNPKLSSQLDPLIDQLRQISQSFPHLNSQQLQSLSDIMDKLLQSVKQVPFPAQRVFWNQQLTMMQNLMSENGANIKDFQSEVKELKARSHMLVEVEELVQNIQDALKKQPPTQKDWSQLIENLQSLANKNPMMNPAQSQALVGFFEQLGYFKNTKGIKLSESVADALIQTKLGDFLKTNPSATPEQIKSYLETFLKESNLQTSSLPFMKSLGESIENLLDKEGFPASTGFSGVELATEQNGKVQENSSFFSDLLSDYQPDQHSVNGLERAAQAVSSPVAEEVSGNAAKTEGFQSAIAKLSATQNIFGRAAMWTVGQSLQTGHPAQGAPPLAAAAGRAPLATPAPEGAGVAAKPGPAPSASSQPNLPWNFEQAILKHYMPGQQAYLEELAMVLYLDNNGAMFGNTLLTEMLGFDGASNTYSFSNWLHSSGNNNFSGSYSKAMQQFDNEKTAVSNAINQVKNSLKDIKNELESISNQLENKNLTPSQRQILENQQTSLQDLQQNLMQCYNPTTNTGSLANLRNELGTMTINPPNSPGTKGTAFSVSSTDPDWQSHLGKFENLVINGDPKSQPPGGLINVQAQAQTYQQTYSDQGQNQQMVLQMRMTEIQQEWTVVSTALQLLFQMYSTIAQAIYK